MHPSAILTRAPGRGPRLRVAPIRRLSERRLPDLGQPVPLDALRRAPCISRLALSLVDPPHGGTKMNKFFGFMEGPVGRALRVVLGVALIYLGLGRIGGTRGSMLALVGVLPLLMGALGPCLVHLAVGRFKRA